MNIESKFDKGDVVYLPSHTLEKIWSACPDCLRTLHWKATLPSGEEVSFQCPTCTWGYECTGKVYDYGYEPEIEEFTVGDVRFEGGERGFRYESERSPDGSARLSSESELYRTREEAEAAIPGMIEATERRVHEHNERIMRQRNEKRKKAGDMLSFYRTQKRRAMKELGAAERGIAREMGAPS